MLQLFGRYAFGSARVIPAWPLSLLAVMFVFLMNFYGHILKAPNSVLLTSGGDGLKNYYTYAWHVEHDADLLHYTGSGYPYGDHVFFTDGHPLLSWVFQVLPFLAPWKLGVLNLILLLGIACSAFFVFVLLRRFALAPWACFVGAFSITVLQPQLFRLGGHLSLAHCWVFPLTWYLLLRTRSSRRWLLPAGLVGAVVAIAFLTHPYLGLMSALFIAGYYGVLLLARWRSVGRSTRTWVEPLIMVAAPLVLFLILMNGGDVVPDRPLSPGGADIYATRLISLMVPTHPPLSTPLTEFFRYEKLEWESWCYLGLSSLLMLIVVGAVQIKRWSRGAEPSPPSDDLPLYMGSAFLVLLFAMGEWQTLLGNAIPMLAQFRGTGRFAWVFFHVCTVFCTVKAYRYLFSIGPSRKVVVIPVFVIIVGFYAVEGWAYHKGMSLAIGHSPNTLEHPDAQLEELIAAVRSSGAQAIIPLPYMHVGSERYWRGAPEPIFALAYPISYRTALPLMAGVTSRTSLSRTRALMAVLAPIAYTKSLADEVPPHAKFAILRSNDALDSDEQQLWDRGTPLQGNNAGSLRTITAEELFASDADHLRERFNAERGRTIAHGAWWLSAFDSAPGSGLMEQTFTAADTEPITGVAHDYTTLLKFDAGRLDSTLSYEASFLFHAVDPNAVNISFIMEHTLPDGSNGVWQELRNVRSMPMQVEDWSVTRMIFKADHPDRAYKLFLKGPDSSNDRFGVYHVLLRPVQLDAWREGSWNGTPCLFWNNIPLVPNASPAKEP